MDLLGLWEKWEETRRRRRFTRKLFPLILREQIFRVENYFHLHVLEINWKLPCLHHLNFKRFHSTPEVFLNLIEIHNTNKTWRWNFVIKITTNFINPVIPLNLELIWFLQIKWDSLCHRPSCFIASSALIWLRIGGYDGRQYWCYSNPTFKISLFGETNFIAS